MDFCLLLRSFIVQTCATDNVVYSGLITLTPWLSVKSTDKALLLAHLKGQIRVGYRGRSVRGPSPVPWSYLEIQARETNSYFGTNTIQNLAPLIQIFPKRLLGDILVSNIENMFKY